VTRLFSGQVHLSCKAVVGGRELVVQQSVAQPVYDDPDARRAVEHHMRYQLMMKILEHWTPKIRVRREL